MEKSDKNMKRKRIKIKKDPFYKREAEKYENPIPSREFIAEHLEELGRPASYSHFIRAFNLEDPESQEALGRRLKAMLRDGQLIENRRGSYALAKQMALVRGRVSVHKEGFGFLHPEDGSEKIFLPPHQLRSVFHGDQVLVSISEEDSRGRRNGNIVEILERGLTQVVGRYSKEDGVAWVEPLNKHINHEVLIPPGKEGGARLGQIVVADIISYPKGRQHALGKVAEILGEHMAPGMEVDIAIHAFGLPHVWSDEVLAESEKFAKTVTESDKKGRKDLTDLPFVTIDGEDARDFDDAVYCEKNSADNSFHLYVAIADVSHYVKINTHLDQEAWNRGTSVYFPGAVIPMLPEALSNELCSLRPAVERLVLVCDMVVTQEGKVKHFSFYDAVIRSQARLTYTLVAAMLDGKSSKQPALLPYLKALRDVYLVLKKERQIRGALNFDLPETRIIYGKGRKIKKIIPFERNFAHELIEECMLAANVSTAKFLAQAKVPFLYRVHPGPDMEKLDQLRFFLGGLGIKLPGSKQTQPGDYAKLLTMLAGRPDEHMLNMIILRSLQQAIYTPDNAGHFGLAYKEYTHFTSPIRRYPDLLNHRAIKYVLSKQKSNQYPYDHAAINNSGEHCSMTERRADDATRDAIGWLKCEYMLDKVGKTYDGVISGVMNFGVFVELKEVYVEGLIHITSLQNDYYRFDPVRHCLEGKRTRKCYRIGDQVRIVVARVDLDSRQIDFALA